MAYYPFLLFASIVLLEFNTTFLATHDKTPQCVDRTGQHVRCLASVGFHIGDDKNSAIVLRLWPLVTRNICVPWRPSADGQQGEAAAVTAAASAPAVGSARALIRSSTGNNSSLVRSGSSSTISSSASGAKLQRRGGYARPPTPPPSAPPTHHHHHHHHHHHQSRPTGAGVPPPVPFRHYWARTPEAQSQPYPSSQPHVAPRPSLQPSHGHAVVRYGAVAPPSRDRALEEGQGVRVEERGLEGMEDDMWDLLSESLESP